MPIHAAYFPSPAQAYGKALFICSGLEIAGYQSLYNSYSKVWNYRYNVKDAIYVALGYGVPHVSKNAAIWGVGPIGSGIGVGGSYTAYNSLTIPVIQDCFINFIKHLDPNGIQTRFLQPKWNNIGSGLAQQRLLFEFDRTRMESVPVEQLKRCLFLTDSTWETEI